MILVLDAGALIAVDRGDRDVGSRLRSALAAGHPVHVPAGVIGQAWRNPSRQAQLSRMLKRCEEVVLDGSAARASGQLCGKAGTSDVIDASVAVAVAEAKRREAATPRTSTAYAVADAAPGPVVGVPVA